MGGIRPNAATGQGPTDLCPARTCRVTRVYSKSERSLESGDVGCLLYDGHGATQEKIRESRKPAITIAEHADR